MKRSERKATVSEKGQVTIPKAIRDRLGIGPGVVIEFEEEGGRLMARKVQVGDPVEAVYGILRLRRSTDDLLNELRGGRPERR